MTHWTTADIAREFGVKQRTVTDKWSKRPTFPKPCRRISSRLVWWLPDDIRAWASHAASNGGR